MNILGFAAARAEGRVPFVGPALNIHCQVSAMIVLSRRGNGTDGR
jgi:hypothetical protein